MAYPMEGKAVDSTMVVADSLGDRILKIQSAGTHTLLFTGDVYYVDGGQADDTGDGTSPRTAKKTIAAGLALLSAGDALTVKAGTYDESGLDLDQSSIELHLEAGTILQDSSDGTVLTVSAFGCLVEGRGNVRIDPTGGATGVLVSGSFCWLSNLRVNANDVGAIGYDITGAGAELNDCRCASPTTAAFKVQADKTQLYECCTGGTTGAGTIGFWATNNCDKVRFNSCGSQGHSTAGFQVDSGCTNGVASNCHSGGGDGKRIDNGALWHWPNFEGVATKEQHYEVYPASDGEGTAGDPISLDTDAEDETNGPASTANYWGEPKVILAPEVESVLWSWFGLGLFADTASKLFQLQWLRINIGVQSDKNAGNAWDEGATDLTVDDGSKFQAGDLVWIYSDYVTDGEIQRVDSVAGNVVTVEREGSQFGGANTGLRWDHTTNNAGTEVMYLVYRPSSLGMHPTESPVSFGSSKDSVVRYFPEAREFNADDGLLVRMLNQSDDTNGAALDVSILYRDGGAH